MRKSDFYYTSLAHQPSRPKCITMAVLVIFCFTVTTFSVFEISNVYADKDADRSIFKDIFQSFVAAEASKFPDKKYEQDKVQQDELLNSERQARAATENNTVSGSSKSNSYYEEQRPVVVYSRTDVDSPIARRQMAEIPPKQDAEDDDPYSKAYDSAYEDSDLDYFGQPEPKQSPPSPYYGQQQEQPQASSAPYYRQPPSSYYRQPQSYYDNDSGENFQGRDAEQFDSHKARAKQYPDGNNYYRPYSYATPTPTGMGNIRRLPAANNAAIRNIPMTAQNQAQQQQQQYRDRYPSYTDVYEYQPANHHAPAASQLSYLNHNYPPQMPQFRTPSTPAPTTVKQKPETGNQMDYLTMFKSMKTMWDLYQSFISSWNTINEKRNREEELAKQKYKQQQQNRINSRKPPKFATRRNTTTANKGMKKQSTTMATRTTISPTGADKFATAADAVVTSTSKQPLAKVEPRQGPNAHNEESIRDKRQAADDAKDTTSVAEGRYIKGDPLKGYYDFVITEGSYKFWAAFQVGTAILVIYSTFAAIYYSKVNPLVSDYDYTDYLGGGRSLSGGDVDFVDDGDEDSVGKTLKNKSWFEWLPRSGHSLKTILDAIDRLPADHSGEQGEKENQANEADSVAESAGDQADVEVDASNSNENEQIDENLQVSQDSASLSKTQRSQGAM